MLTQHKKWQIDLRGKILHQCVDALEEDALIEEEICSFLITQTTLIRVRESCVN